MLREIVNNGCFNDVCVNAILGFCPVKLENYLFFNRNQCGVPCSVNDQQKISVSVS